MGELLKIQARVIGALVLRETRATFGTSKVGYLWAIIVPAASTAVLMAIFVAIGRQAPFGSSLPLFFATGILTLEFFNKLSKALMGALSANRALLVYPVIKDTDILYARLILVSATYLIIMLLFYSGFVFLGIAEAPYHLEELVQVFFVTALMGFGFGALNAVVISLWNSWRNVESILMRPLFFISGIFYVPSNLPTTAINFLKWNPVLHLIEWVRYGYYSNYDSVVLSKGYPLCVAIFLTLLGLGGERLYRKKRVG